MSSHQNDSSNVQQGAVSLGLDITETDSEQEMQHTESTMRISCVALNLPSLISQEI